MTDATLEVETQGEVFCFYFETKKESYPWRGKFITVPEIRAAVGHPGSTDPLVVEQPDGSERQLREDEKVDLGKPCRFGRSPRFKRGMEERKEEELRLLLLRFPQLKNVGKGWIEIPDYELPSGLYNAAKTTLGFLIPPEYPVNPPDNFYVTAGLKFKDGRTLTNYGDGGGPCGGTWGVFSYHRETWAPGDSVESGDNLMTFVRAITLRLQEAI